MRATLALALVAGAAGCDEDGNPIVPDLVAPVAPALSLAGNGVRVAWEPVAVAESYAVQRDVIGDAAGFTEVASDLTATQYTDTGISPGTTYQYRVVAIRGVDRRAGDPREIRVPGAADDQVQLSGTIAAGQTRRLSADSVYLLRGAVVVDSGAVLRIPAGTRVLGDVTVRPTYLLVRQGGQIFAEGTAERPIVFTSSRAVGQRNPGDWGGIVIAGRSRCNFPAPCQVEGANARYGGDRADDDSGILRYVRIEFAGFEVTPGNELNALTLAGVGSGTRIDHIQVHRGSDDGIEWFGGTVNVSYALATGNEDDSFDYSSGWTGRGQFWIAQQLENAGDKAFEVDGNETVFTATPLTDPQVYNVTLVGRGSGATSSNDAVQLRRGVRGDVVNAIVYGWGGAVLDVDDQATANHCADGNPLMDHVVWFDAGGGLADEDSDGFEAVCAGTSVRNLDPQLAAATNRAEPDFRPAAGSPVLTGAAPVPNDPFFSQVDYLGAVAPTGTPWYQGWTTFAVN